jgi:hypothetical protein
MKAIALAVAALAIVGSASIATAEPIRLAQADVSVRIGGGGGGPGYNRGYSERRFDRGYRAQGCKTVTVRERRGNTVVVRKSRSC